MTVRRIQDDENVHRLRLLQQEVQMALPVRSQPVAVRQLIGEPRYSTAHSSTCPAVGGGKRTEAG